jgi:hypothetical protein
MSAIFVFLDTNALPRHPTRLGIGFERLAEIADAGLVKVYLSEVVAKEWISQLQKEFLDDVNQANIAMQRVLRHPWSSGIEALETIRVVKDDLDNAVNLVPEISEKEAKALIARLNAEILPVDVEHGSLVIQAYFSGSEPFQKAKNREDFPDAFIFHCIKDLAKKVNNNLHCIVADKVLKAALSKLDKVVVHDSIKDFIQSQVVLDAIHEEESEQRWQTTFERILPLLPTLESYLKDGLYDLYVDDLAYEHISHRRMPSDNKEAIITGVHGPDDIIFKWDSVENYGSGTITLPVTFTCQAEIEFDIYRGNAFDIPDEVWVDLADPEENYYFEAGATVKLSVEALLSIAFDLEQVPDEILSEPEDVSLEEITDINVVEDETEHIFF